MTKNNYDASQIRVLEGLDAVRFNPGMYVGDSDTKGLHHLVWEICDNSIDEAMAGHCNEIKIKIEKDGETISIEDNGRGIPVDMHPTEKKSALEVVLTVLHAGGKFGGSGSGYDASGGLHGVGASCVNALSDLLVAEVHRDGYLWQQSFSEGKPKGKIQKIRSLDKKDKQTGTKIQWHADKQIFKNGIKYNDNIITKRLKEMAFLNKGLKISFINESTGINETFCFDGGIVDYLKYLSEGKEDTYPATPIYASAKSDLTSRPGQQCQVEIALLYSNDDDESIISFVNNIVTTDGGTHVSGFKTALTRVVNTFARNNKLIKENAPNLNGDDVREGLSAIVSIRFPRPEFVSQTKSKLGSTEAETVVSNLTTNMLTSFFDKNAPIVKKIVERALIAQEARTAAKKQSDLIKRKGFLGKSNRMPGKLYDCNTENVAISELFIVEGDSAAGCFSGDTMVCTSPGALKTFKQLVEDYNNGIVYEILSKRKDGDSWCYLPAENPRITRKDAELLKITFKSKEVVKCTPDHLFMLNNFEYKKAKDLTPDDVFMTIYDNIINDLDNEEAKAYFKDRTVVESIEYLEQKEDVYDITVAETHNFALFNGVFVHNSGKDGRDPEFQAILPIRGKIINAEKKDIASLLKNKEIQSLIIAIGTGIKEDFNIEKLRYNKIILMADADDDGCHISTLLLTFFYRYMKPLVANGHLYLAQPPLYCVDLGKSRIFAWTDQEMQLLVKQNPKSKVVRFKGLGEMDADQLADTTMNVENRRLIKLELNDLAESERMVSVLMGSNVQLRKDHIINQVNSVIKKA